MKKKRALIQTIITIIVPGLLLTGCHHPRTTASERFEKKVEKHIEQVLNSIDATDEQKTRIHAIADAIQQDFATTYRNRSFDYHEALENVFSDHPYAPQLHEQLDAKAEKMNAFSHRMLDRLLEINAVLTPEQRSELKQKFQKAHGKMR